MASALIYLVVVLAVAAVVYLLAAVVFGRGEQLEALPPGSTPTRLPPSDIESSDVRALRFQQVVRGYKASEVDWALERVAGELDELRGRVVTLERQLDLAGEQLRHEGAQGSSASPESPAKHPESPARSRVSGYPELSDTHDSSGAPNSPSSPDFPDTRDSAGERE